MRKVVATIVGGLILTARSRMAPWVLVILMGASAAHAGGGNVAGHKQQGEAPMTRAQLTEYVDNLVGGQRQDMERLARLERACVLTYTGGGVTQCAQPSTYSTRLFKALGACAKNGAYIGVTGEDTWHLMAQCWDDYLAMH